MDKSKIYDKSKIKFTRQIFDIFVKEAMLNEEEVKILRWRIDGWSIKRMTVELQYASETTISSRIKELKRKYDEVQKYHPELPPRRHSEIEDWMDNPDSDGIYNE